MILFLFRCYCEHFTIGITNTTAVSMAWRTSRMLEVYWSRWAILVSILWIRHVCPINHVKGRSSDVLIFFLCSSRRKWNIALGLHRRFFVSSVGVAPSCWFTSRQSHVPADGLSGQSTQSIGARNGLSSRASGRHISHDDRHRVEIEHCPSLMVISCWSVLVVSSPLSAFLIWNFSWSIPPLKKHHVEHLSGLDERHLAAESHPMDILQA